MQLLANISLMDSSSNEANSSYNPSVTDHSRATLAPSPGKLYSSYAPFSSYVCVKYINIFSSSEYIIWKKRTKTSSWIKWGFNRGESLLRVSNLICSVDEIISRLECGASAILM